MKLIELLGTKGFLGSERFPDACLGLQAKQPNSFSLNVRFLVSVINFPAAEKEPFLRCELGVVERQTGAVQIQDPGILIADKPHWFLKGLDEGLKGHGSQVELLDVPAQILEIFLFLLVPFLILRPEDVVAAAELDVDHILEGLSRI